MNSRAIEIPAILFFKFMIGGEFNKSFYVMIYVDLC